MVKKEKVTIFLKRNIEDLNYRLDKKDNFGNPSWCPASRCAFKERLEYYEYLLRMMERKK